MDYDPNVLSVLRADHMERESISQRSRKPPRPSPTEELTRTHLVGKTKTRKKQKTPTAEIHSRKSIRGNPRNRGKLKKIKKNIEMQEEGKTFTPKVQKERPFLNQTDLVTQPAPKRRGEG